MYKFKVYIDDTDCFQVVYHANYLKYFERARTEFLHQHKIYHKDLKNIKFIVSNIELKYLKPAKLEDLCTIEIKLKNITSIQIFFEQILYVDKTPFVKAFVTIVTVNDKFKPRIIPTSIKDKLIQKFTKNI